MIPPVFQKLRRITTWLGLGFVLAACRPGLTPDTRNSLPENAPLVSSAGISTPNFADRTSKELSVDQKEEIVMEPTSSNPPAAYLPDLGQAPDFANDVWLNSDQPLNLRSLRGKVVLVEFWTFG